ncbi:hypothetical protein T310_8953, partial [Rasamsonia emersonii CBS 393.64]
CRPCRNVVVGVGRNATPPPGVDSTKPPTGEDEAFFLEAIGWMEWIVPNLDMQPQGLGRHEMAPRVDSTKPRQDPIANIYNTGLCPTGRACLRTFKRSGEEGGEGSRCERVLVAGVACHRQMASMGIRRSACQLLDAPIDQFLQRVKGLQLRGRLGHTPRS